MFREIFLVTHTDTGMPGSVSLHMNIDEIQYVSILRRLCIMSVYSLLRLDTYVTITQHSK